MTKEIPIKWKDQVHTVLVDDDAYTLLARHTWYIMYSGKKKNPYAFAEVWRRTQGKRMSALQLGHYALCSWRLLAMVLMSYNEDYMKLTVKYEWDIEQWLGEEIMSHAHSDKCPAAPLFREERLVLVRDVGNDDKGVVHRLWAYVVDNKLPEFFENADLHTTRVKVPRRFHKELASARAQ